MNSIFLGPVTFRESYINDIWQNIPDADDF